MDDGSLKVGKKSDLVQCLVGQLKDTHVPYFDCNFLLKMEPLKFLISGHMLMPNRGDLFNTYFKEVFIPNVN